MGCSESVEDQMYLAKLSRLEVQVAKQKEMEKLAKLEGKNVEDLNILSISKSKTDLENTEPKSIIQGTYTNKVNNTDKKKKNKSVNKAKKKKKVKDDTTKKKKRAKSEVNKKKKKKKK